MWGRIKEWALKAFDRWQGIYCPDKFVVHVSRLVPLGNGKSIDKLESAGVTKRHCITTGDLHAADYTVRLFDHEREVYGIDPIETMQFSLIEPGKLTIAWDSQGRKLTACRSEEAERRGLA